MIKIITNNNNNDNNNNNNDDNKKNNDNYNVIETASKTTNSYQRRSLKCSLIMIL